MRTVVFSMPDITPHFFDEHWKMPGVAGPLLAANIPQHTIIQADLITQRTRVRQAITAVIREYRPQVVGLSAMAFQYYSACRTAECVRALDPSIAIGLGGYHATTSHEEIAASPEGALFDFMVRGEGEATFGEYLDRAEAGQPPDGVLGLSFRTGAEWVHNARRPNLDLDRLKPPTRAVRVWKDFSFYGRRIDMFESSRGCTLDCSFCSISGMYGRTYRRLPIEYTLTSIEDAMRHGANTLALSDDNLGLDPDHLLRVCQAIVEHGYHRALYMVQLPPRLVATRPDVVEAMAAAGMRIVFLGVETIDPDRVQSMDVSRKTGAAAEYTHTAVEVLRKHRMITTAGMIFGLPGETPEGIERHFRWCAEQGLSIADFMLNPYPNTRQRVALEAGGYVAGHDLRRYDGFWANTRTDWMSPWDLEYWRWYYYWRYVKLWGGPVGWSAVLPWVYYVKKYVLRPIRAFLFAVQDPVRSFERYQRRRSRVNHLFGEAYPDMFTRRTHGGKLGTLEDRAEHVATPPSSAARGSEVGIANREQRNPEHPVDATRPRC
jgi:anaerobic magnesium-protoporphyrin IX monomethyl ester cyclase